MQINEPLSPGMESVLKVLYRQGYFKVKHLGQNEEFIKKIIIDIFTGLPYRKRSHGCSISSLQQQRGQIFAVSKPAVHH